MEKLKRFIPIIIVGILLIILLAFFLHNQNKKLEYVHYLTYKLEETNYNLKYLQEERDDLSLLDRGQASAKALNEVEIILEMGHRLISDTLPSPSPGTGVSQIRAVINGGLELWENSEFIPIWSDGISQEETAALTCVMEEIDILIHILDKPDIFNVSRKIEEFSQTYYTTIDAYWYSNKPWDFYR